MRTLLLVSVAVAGSAPFASAQNWSSWKPDSTYHGIEVRTRCTGYNEFAGRYLWDVQLRNRYPKNVDVAWAAEPQRLHGSEFQGDQALGVAPGETVDAHHTAPVNCSSGLTVRVNKVQGAGNPSAIAQASPQQRQQFQGRWVSHDPEEFRKSFTVQVSGDSLTGQWSSPGFSFEITTPMPRNIQGSVSVNSSTAK